MDKNFKSDISILTKISIEIDKMCKTLHRFNINTQNDLLKDTDILDLCAFRVFQIGELAKKLTDDSKNNLSFTSLVSVTKLRDKIGHTYNLVNKSWLVSVVFMLTKPTVVMEVQNRIIYCKNNKKS